MDSIGFDDFAILRDVLAFELFKVFEDGIHVGYQHGGRTVGVYGSCASIVRTRIGQARAQPDLSARCWRHVERV